MVPKFDPKELTPAPGASFSRPVERFSFPLSQFEANEKAYKGEPWWQMQQAIDTHPFMPDIIPDNIARGFVFEANMAKYAPNEMKGGPDMFGIEWEYIPTVSGSMVRPGVPFLEDIEDWEEKIVWPDVDSWDWEGCAERNKDFLKPDHFNQFWFFSGYYERLISMMEFEGALMTITDEDCQPFVHAFFDKLTDLYIDIFKHLLDYLPTLNAVFFHDDWGGQLDTFFPPSVVEEMIVPYMKRCTDYLHSRGVWCELHSCGAIYKQIPNIIKAGWDMWSPQLMNDCYKMYDDYGDQLIIATYPQNIPEEIMALGSEAAMKEAFAALPEEQQRQIAYDYIHRVYRKDRQSFYAFYAAHWLTQAFKEVIYEESRKISAGEYD